MNGELIVFGVLAIGVLSLYAIAADYRRTARREADEAASRRRIQREVADIGLKRPHHIVQVSDQVEKNTPRSER
jgi:hypothetical protein